MTKQNEMSLFILQLILIAHLILIKKLPTGYLKLFSRNKGNVLYRLIIVIIMIIVLSYDEYTSTLLLGLILIFGNKEYLQRKKMLGIN